MVYGQESDFYLFDDKGRHKFLGKTRYRIANNHHRGGQSQNRLARLRVEQIHHYISQIEENIQNHFTKNGVAFINQLVLCGPGLKKEQVKGRLDWLKRPIITLSDLDFETVCQRFSSIISAERKENSDDYLNEIKEHIRVSPDRLVFGMETIHEQYYAGNLEKLYCTDKKVWLKSKTELAEMDELSLKDFGGCIGLLWTSFD